MPAPILLGYTSNTVQGTNEITLDKPFHSDEADGDYLILLVGSDDNLAPERFANPLIGPESPGTKWKKPYEIGNATTQCHHAMYWRRADGTEADTITISHTSNDDLWGFYLRVKAEERDLIRVAIGQDNQGSASTRDIPGVALDGDCLCIFGMAFDGGDATFSVSGTGWSKEDDINTGGAGNQAAGVFGTRSTTTALKSGSVTVGTVVSDGSTGKQFAIVEGRVKEWALIVIQQLIEDIGTDASGWDADDESTSISPLLEEAVAEVGLTRNANLSVNIRNAIRRQLKDALDAEGVAGADFRKKERNANQTQMADAIAAAEAYFIAEVNEIRSVGA